MNNYETARERLSVLFCHCKSMDSVTLGDFKAVVSVVCALMDEAQAKAIKEQP